MRQMTVFVNLFQNLGSGYMKLLPEFQIESISAIEEKTREDQISLYLRADLSPAQLPHCLNGSYATVNITQLGLSVS
jgi:hypothetical protein